MRLQYLNLVVKNFQEPRIFQSIRICRDRFRHKHLVTGPLNIMYREGANQMSLKKPKYCLDNFYRNHLGQFLKFFEKQLEVSSNQKECTFSYNVPFEYETLFSIYLFAWGACSKRHYLCPRQRTIDNTLETLEIVLPIPKCCATDWIIDFFMKYCRKLTHQV